MPVALPAAPPARREPRLTGRAVLFSLVAFFLVVAGANAVMITAAMTTFGGTRTDSSYRAGQRFAAEHAAVAAQDALGWTVEASLATEAAAASAAASERTISVTALDRDGAPLTGVEAEVVLQHPADSRRDVMVAMRPAAAGGFTGSVAAAEGQWDLVIDLLRDGTPVFRSTQRVFLP